MDHKSEILCLFLIQYGILEVSNLKQTCSIGRFLTTPMVFYTLFNDINKILNSGRYMPAALLTYIFILIISSVGIMESVLVFVTCILHFEIK